MLDLLTLVVAPLLVWWATRVGRARGGAWRWLPVAPLAAVVVGVCGLLGTIVALALAFETVAQVDPSRKAVVLSESIASAMWITVVSAGSGWALILGTLGACVVGTLRAPPPETT
jgi:hypothetical protein